MTREEMIMKLTELRTKAEEAAKAFNEFMLDSEFGKASAEEEKIDEACSDYTHYAQTICFDELAETDDPMFEACKRLAFSTIRGKDERIEDSKLKRKVIEDVDKQIDLAKLNEYIKGGIGADKNWPHAIAKLGLMLTAQKAVDLGLDPKEVNDSYGMSKIAREYDLGKNPASKTNLLKTLTTIIQLMLGTEFKAVSHDVNFLMSIYSKKSRKALTVTCANEKQLRGYITEICHRLVTGGHYEVEYKKARN